MCQLAGTFSAGIVLYSVPRVTSLATTTSTGRTTWTPRSSAAARIARASSTRSGSARLLPTGLPCASRKVFAIPPPMTMTSTLSSRCLRTLILSLTLAPPMIAANGCSGLSSELAEVGELLLHEEARRRPGGASRCRRSRRARGGRCRTRRSRRRRSTTRAPPRTPGRSSPPPRGSGGSRAAAPRRCACRRTASSVPTPSASPVTGTVLADQLAEALGRPGRSRRLSVTLPSGRPRWLARITRAPCACR